MQRNEKKIRILTYSEKKAQSAVNRNLVKSFI